MPANIPLARRATDRHLRVVAIGGGTGLSMLLHGFKECARLPAEPNQRRALAGGLAARDASPGPGSLATCWPRAGASLDVGRRPARPRGLWPAINSRGPVVDLSAVVTVTDEGGSSGRLRREFGMLPPGDIRRCLVALSEDEALLSQLFEYRFAQGRGLKGHSFGNLFLTALTHVTGDFQHALRVSSEVLVTCGKIFPSTLANVRLQARLENGRVVTGETRISRSRSRIAEVRLLPSGCRPVPETLQALAEADLITLGPGSLFTSLIPNLLVKGLPQRIAASAGVKVYVGNLMMQPGETVGFTAADHIQALYDHAGVAFFDYAVLNNGPISPSLLRRYLAQGARSVENDLERIRKMGIRPVLDDLVAEGAVVRHNPFRLARRILELARGAGHRGKGEAAR